LPQLTDASLPQLDDQLGFQLRLAQLAVFSDIIDALKRYDIRPADLSTLLLIAENPGMRQHVIGDRLKMARPNVVSLVDALEGKKLAERVVDEADRRAYKLHLTQPGEELLQILIAAQADHRARMMTALEGVDVDNFMQGLKQLAQLGQN
jgi:DNA-binding MarR family transcriptional regulator